MIDGGLAAHRRVHVRQQRGRNLYQIDAALIAGGNEARQIADDTAAQRQHDAIAPDAIGDHDVEYAAGGAQRLVLLAIGQDHFHHPLPLQALLERLGVQRRDHRIADQHRVAAGQVRGQQFARTQQPGADQDRVGALAQADGEGLHDCKYSATACAERAP